MFAKIDYSNKAKQPQHIKHLNINTLTMENNLIIGDRYEGVLLETFIDDTCTRPRVRPIEYFETDIRVEFPRHLREENPIGTRFRGDLKVAQKNKNGKPFGRPYLVVTDKSIVKIEEYTPKRCIKAVKLNTISDRAYTYIEKQFNQKPKNVEFDEFRKYAYNHIKDTLKTIESKKALNHNRSDIIKTYALTRSNGKCEGCDSNAPFLKHNGQPYLEVHHLIELSNDGQDIPTNVIALCPNCHARVTYGKDGKPYNNQLIKKVLDIENSLNK